MNDEIRELAENATPGPWSWHHYPADVVLGSNGVDVVGVGKPFGDLNVCLMKGPYDWDADAAFIAAANPSAVLALLAELVALRVDCDQLRTALAFYAKETNYAVTQAREPRSVVHQDNGERARVALAAVDG